MEEREVRRTYSTFFQFSRELRKTPIVTLVLCLLTLTSTLPILFDLVTKEAFELNFVKTRYLDYEVCPIRR